MNLQCSFSNQSYKENEIARALDGDGTSSCPLLSDLDAQMIWQDMSFMMKAVDKLANLPVGKCQTSMSTPTLFLFLERLLVANGILVPLACSYASLHRSEVFFVPSLLAQVDPEWTYCNYCAWKTTLCHSWLFRDGAPSDLMEDITVAVLRDLYECSRSFQGSLDRQPQSHIRTVPLVHSSFHEFYKDHRDQSQHFRIHQIMCWQTSVLIKVGTVFADPETKKRRESLVKMLITMVDQSSDACVASDVMRSGMHRIIVSAKGQAGHAGIKIWKGGYRRILDSVESTLKSYANVDSQVVCPACLAEPSLARRASTWSLDSVQAAKGSNVTCIQGHCVETNLICGTYRETLQDPLDDTRPYARHEKKTPEILPSVVLVGLWDSAEKKIKRVGSGFVVDSRLCLVDTAAHLLFSFEEGANFGTPYGGLRHAKVVIGVLEDDSRKAVFRYFGDIVGEDVHHVDACVVRITTRMENDVDDEGPGCADQPETPLDSTDVQNEQLRELKMARRFYRYESVRLLGFNQGDKGILEPGKHVNRHVDVTRGYVCGEFKMPASDNSSSHSSDSDTDLAFVPRKEIIIMCPTIPGHSGGPFVNFYGKVVGMLSRADPVNCKRCYLVPFSELRPLVKKAKNRCSVTHLTV